MKKKQLNEYHVDSINLHFIETDYDGRHYYYDDNKGRYVGRGGTPENPAYLYTACGRDWEPDSEVECDNINVLSEGKKKVTIKESQLRTMISEAIRTVLKEDVDLTPSEGEKAVSDIHELLIQVLEILEQHEKAIIYATDIKQYPEMVRKEINNILDWFNVSQVPDDVKYMNSCMGL